jgi:hypothetical protein
MSEGEDLQKQMDIIENCLLGIASDLVAHNALGVSLDKDRIERFTGIALNAQLHVKRELGLSSNLDLKGK